MFRWSARRVGAHRARSGTALSRSPNPVLGNVGSLALHSLQLQSQYVVIGGNSFAVQGVDYPASTVVLLYILRVEIPEELPLPPRY